MSNYSGDMLVYEMNVVIPNQTPGVDFKEMDEQIKTMMSSGFRRAENCNVQTKQKQLWWAWRYII